MFVGECPHHFVLSFKRIDLQEDSPEAATKEQTDRRRFVQVFLVRLRQLRSEVRLVEASLEVPEGPRESDQNKSRERVQVMKGWLKWFLLACFVPPPFLIR